MLWSLRPAAKEDESLIFSSWLKSHRDSPTVSGVSNTVYYARFHDLIEAILSAPDTQVTVACSPTDPEQIFGYSVRQGDVLHWVYVKHAFRKYGLGKVLADTFKIHTTRARESSVTKDSCFDPFILWSNIK